MSQSDPNRDLLLQRALEGTASETDWVELEELAEHDSGVWRDLSMSLRDASMLGHALEDAVAAADRVELPAGTASHRVAVHRTFAWGRWAGWAAAAAVAALWIGSAFVGGSAERFEGAGRNGSLARMSGGEEVVQPVATTPSTTVYSSEEALELYRQLATTEGRLVGELPLILVDSEPLTDSGKTEVTYLRRLLERRLVDGMAERSLDEAGRPVAVPVSNTRLVSQQF